MIEIEDTFVRNVISGTQSILFGRKSKMRRMGKFAFDDCGSSMWAYCEW
jgi:hypothetical protein